MRKQTRGLSLKLAIGTAQFGLSYGIANRSGKISQEEIDLILAHARIMGVDTLDTAASYGDSEQSLGMAGVDSFRIVTKLPGYVSADVDSTEWVRTEFKKSLRRLKTPNVYGLLVHRSSQLLGKQGDGIIKGLHNLREEGRITKIGVSIYDPSELDAVISLFVPDLVQAPFNVLDRRLQTSGWLARLEDLGIEVHARSVFLQGLLLLPPERMPKQFMKWNNVFSRWRTWLVATKTSAVAACLAAATVPSIARIVIGVDSLAHLESSVREWKEAHRCSFPNISCNDTDLINPSNWS